ncbi:MAG: [LysW]-aminoadipate kinase [Candidatus Roizmanbacteria bacterium]
MILIKIGGGARINLDAICCDVALLQKTEHILIVHGASVKRDEIADKLGFPTKTVISPSGISSVFTDEKAMEIFLMVYAGLANKKIVAAMQKHGVNAVGLSGVDGKLIVAKAKNDIYVKEGEKTKLMTGNRTGKVEQINSDLLTLLIDKQYVPVLCPPAISYQNEIVNTDNDSIVAMLAGALKVEKVVSLFEAKGMLKDFNDPESIIANVSARELDDMMPFAQGRMKKKLLGAKKALELGVKEIYWGDGRIERPVFSALEGNGTVIR